MFKWIFKRLFWMFMGSCILIAFLMRDKISEEFKKGTFKENLKKIGKAMKAKYNKIVNGI